MKHRLVLLTVAALVLVQAAITVAGPILKPRKYHGPIPRGSLMLRFGFLGGAENTEMLDFLDNRLSAPFEAFSNDFDNAFNAEVAYMYKVHPQVGVRANVSANFLRSDGNGFFVPSLSLPDTVDAPQLDYTRDIDVDLFIGEVSAIYFFTDAAVNEFQPYLGGGFTLGVPHAKFTETQIIGSPTDEFFTHGDVFNKIERDRWSAEPGLHGVLGALYFIGNLYAVSIEARYQVLQSKFPLQTLNEDGEFEEVNFDINYTGFYLNAGIARSF